MEGPPRRVGSLSLAATRVDDVAQRLQTSAKVSAASASSRASGPSRRAFAKRAPRRHRTIVTLRAVA